MNEAAILAARRDLKEISKDEISDALERIIAGPEKKNAVVSEEKKKLVAYHGRLCIKSESHFSPASTGNHLTNKCFCFAEAGHALVGALMPEYDPVAKISIIPRGQAGGLTFFAPSEERLESGPYSGSYLENQMAVALGGRFFPHQIIDIFSNLVHSTVQYLISVGISCWVAEEIIFGTESGKAGASNEFMQVSRVERQMVERFGFSKKIGQVGRRDVREAMILKWVLYCYEAWPRLKVNFNKSSLVWLGRKIFHST